MKHKIKRRIVTYVTFICMMVSLLPVTVFANPDIPADAIQLSTPEDILALAENCRLNTWSVGKTVVLANDIDMTGVEFTGIPTFGGVFVGQGHVISGINMEQEGSVVGFFRYLQKTAVVEGVNIGGIYLPEGSHSVIGGFVGNNAGHIYNCNFEGIVAGSHKIGGFAGINATNGLIENCTVSGIIYGNHFVGGFVGENQGVVRKCTNQAQVNTQSVQNSVEMEDITLDSVINTESANITTDIGGIAGSNSGVIRSCTNKGLIGYQRMGYNVGGIVGTQNGYVVDCTNYAEVQGRKEIGGIVGHMEPNIVVEFNKDTLQTLSDQMSDLEASMKALEGSIQDATTEVEQQLDDMEDNLTSVEDSIDELKDSTEDFSESMEAIMTEVEVYVDAVNALIDEIEKISESDETTAIDNKIEELEDALVDLADSSNMDEVMTNYENVASLLEELENMIDESSSTNSPILEEKLEDLDKASENLDEVLNDNGLSADYDRVLAATNNLGSALEDISTESKKMTESIEDVTSELSDKIEDVTDQIDRISAIMKDAEDGIQITLEDISDEDTQDDMVGKVYKCKNYGAISGDLNIGGIAGIMAEENDLDDEADTDIYGDESLNITGKVRVVIRECENYGTISAGKQYAGGIVGYMIIGAVLDSVNIGALDALNADYVGGIAGDSNTVVRGCGSKCILAGNAYVGGIAGQGNEVTDCYAFVDVQAYTEKAGAILGDAKELPEGTEEDIVFGNYYYLSGTDIGGIDGISYQGATDQMSLEDFLSLSDVPTAMKTVEIRFIAEGQEDVVFTLNVGESLTMEQIPTLTVEADSEYEWEVIPAVTSEKLGMGEVATVEYLSEDSISNILFNQTYEVAFDLKDTVISSTQRNDKKLSVALAEGTFAKNTILELVDMFSSESTINGNAVVENWNVSISKPGVSKLHYLVSEELDAENLKLYVKDASGAWMEREYVVEGSYIVFDFADGETGFALQESADGNLLAIVLIAAGVISIVLAAILVKKNKKK